MGIFSFVKPGKQIFKTITSVKPNVPTNKAEILKRDLNLATQKRKASESKLDNTIFRIEQQKKRLEDMQKTKSQTQTRPGKQNLAKGTNRVPKKISEFNSFLLSSVAIVINNLSSKNNEEIKVNKYLNNFKFLNQKNIQKKKIINSLLLILKNYKNEKIITALTHGDFKCEHLFMLNNKLEYVIDWENISCRSIFFDLFNYFIPWFVHRSYNYFKIKIFILEFLKTYLPYLLNYISDKYDLYFSIFALERYLRMHNHKTLEFETKHKAYKRYDKLFGKLINDIKYKY